MAKGTARPAGSIAENIHHFGGVRMRVNGSGNLDMTLFSLQDVRSSVMSVIKMANPTDREPFKLSNFITQRAALRCSTDEIGEWFRVNRIIIFMKEQWTEYPN